jgi:hypothetical protein
MRWLMKDDRMLRKTLFSVCVLVMLGTSIAGCASLSSPTHVSPSPAAASAKNVASPTGAAQPKTTGAHTPTIQVTSTPTSVPAPLSYGPNMCVQPNGIVEFFVVSSGSLYIFSPGCGGIPPISSTWVNLGAPPSGITSEPASVSVAIGRIDVFVRGGDGDIYWKYTPNGGWTWYDWQKTDRVESVLAGTAPAVCKDSPISFDLFWVDATTRALMHKAHLAPWHQWRGRQSLGGFCTSTPAARTTVTSNTKHVLVGGSFGALYDCYTTNGGAAMPTWTWKPVGETLYTSGLMASYGPAVTCRNCTNGIFDVFWVDSSRQVRYMQWDPQTNAFVNKQNLGGTSTATPTAAYDPQIADLYVAIRDAINQMAIKIAWPVYEDTQIPPSAFGSWI